MEAMSKKILVEKIFNQFANSENGIDEDDVGEGVEDKE